MPANYAHYRFGRDLIPQLPADVRQCVQRFRRMYDLGLFGPDFFFYYFPFVKNSTRALGAAFHMQSGQEFFTNACKAATSEAARAYLYGLLGHYCLDSVCHPYINRLAEIEEARHVPLESEFERLLLVMDRIPQPHLHDMSGKAKPTRGECMTIAEFYPGATGGKVSLSYKSMAYYVKLLVTPSREKTVRFYTKFHTSLPEYRVPEEENEALSLYTRELLALYEQAAERYPALLAEITALLQEGTPLSKAFAPNFG